MPGRDQTGPWGMGPRTGRGLGYCRDAAVAGYAGGYGRRGFGRGFFGRGRAWRNGFCMTGQPGWARFGLPAVLPNEYDPEAERTALQNEANALQAEIEAIQQRLHALQKSTD